MIDTNTIDPMNPLLFTQSYHLKPHKFTPKALAEKLDNRFIWPRHQRINDEAQFYLSEKYNSIVFNSYNDYFSIVARLTPAILKNVAATTTSNELATQLEFNTRNFDSLYNAFSERFTEDGIERLSLKQMQYVSGLLTSRTAYSEEEDRRTTEAGFSQVGGYWTITCRMPKGRGVWPAFWLLPTLKKWPDGIAKLPEIDVFEGIRRQAADAPNSMRKGYYSVAVHTYDTHNGEMADYLPNDAGLISTNIDLTETFNTYGVYFDQDYKKLVFTFNHVRVADTKLPEDMDGVPFHFLTNLAVGGEQSWREQPVAGDYPASLDIKEITVYQDVPTTPLVLAEQPSEANDVMVILPNGVPITRSQLNPLTEMLIALGEGKLELRRKNE